VNTKRRISILEGLATEIANVGGTASRRSAASRNLTREIKSLARLDYGLPLRRIARPTRGAEHRRRSAQDGLAESQSRPGAPGPPREFTRLWSSLGVDFRLANFDGPQGLALMGFYAGKMGPTRRPLIYVNTAHHPAAVGAAFFARDGASS